MKEQIVSKKCIDSDIIETDLELPKNKPIIETEHKKFKYYCNVCKYPATNNTNLHTHYQSKKHIINVIEIGLENDNFYKELLNFRNTNSLIIEKYKKNNLIKYNYDDFGEHLKNQITPVLNTITKTTDDKNYFCNGCNKIFENKIKYKLHCNECLQSENKNKILKEIIVEIAVQSKQLQEVGVTKIQSPFVRSSKKDKKIKDLKEKIKALEEKNNRLLEVINNYEKKCEKIRDIKEKVTTLHLQNTILEEKCKYAQKENNKLENEFNKKLEEMNKKLEVRNNSLSGTNNTYNNNGRTTFNIIFKDSPPFEFINPFIDKSTGMPYNYDFPEERQILADNHDQSTEIKAKLCNAVCFWDMYKKKELIDFVVNAIVYSYAKSNSKEQSIWNTDITRNSYNVRIRNSKTNRDFWQKDKQGVTLKKILLQPIRQYLLDAMNMYHHYCTQKHLAGKSEFVYPSTKEENQLYSKFMNSDFEDLDLSDEEIITLTMLFCTIVQLKNYILEDSKFSSQVLKKMAVRFYFDKNKCLEQCSTEEEKKEVLKEIAEIEKIEENDKNLLQTEINANEIIDDSEDEIIDDSEDSDYSLDLDECTKNEFKNQPKIFKSFLKNIETENAKINTN